MPRPAFTNANIDPSLKAYLDRLSAEIEKGFLEVDRVVTEEDMLDSNSQLNWFFL
jgi:FMN-dependent NADH-azoreductase